MGDGFPGKGEKWVQLQAVIGIQGLSTAMEGPPHSC